MVVGGLVGVAVCVGLAAWRSMRWTLCGRFELGLAVLGPGVIAAYAASLVLAGPVAALIVPSGAILVGLAIALSAGGGDDGAGELDDEPPWWPSFEQDLERYARERDYSGNR